jgi:uncharacterized glyoxalase superfamily protein PhnB
MKKETSGMWIVEYRSKYPTPSLAAKGGITSLIHINKEEAEKFAESLRARGIEVIAVRPTIK